MLCCNIIISAEVQFGPTFQASPHSLFQVRGVFFLLEIFRLLLNLVAQHGSHMAGAWLETCPGQSEHCVPDLPDNKVIFKTQFAV